LGINQVGWVRIDRTTPPINWQIREDRRPEVGQDPRRSTHRTVTRAPGRSVDAIGIAVDVEVREIRKDFAACSSGRLEVKESGSPLERGGLWPCATLPGRGPGGARGSAGARPGVARLSRPTRSAAPRPAYSYRALSTPSLHRVYRHRMSALDTGHDHDPSAARAQMFYV